MSLSIVIQRGSHHIGGSCTEYSLGDERILVDCGKNLPGSEAKGISDEKLLDTVIGTKENPRPAEALLFTHYHGDHLGLFADVYNRNPAIPMYIGELAKKIERILAEKLEKINGNTKPIVEKMHVFQVEKDQHIGKPLFLAEGRIKVTPIKADHSAIDAYMFLIETEGKRILHSGDFRDHGIASEGGAFEKILKQIGKVDVLLTEATMLSRLRETAGSAIVTEEDLGKRAREIFQAHKVTLVVVSSTNIDSFMEFYRNVPHNREIICDNYQAQVFRAVAASRGEEEDSYSIAKRYCGSDRYMLVLGGLDGLNDPEGRKDNEHYKDLDIPILFDKLNKPDAGVVVFCRPNNDPEKETGRFEKLVDRLRKYDPYIIYSQWEGYLGSPTNPRAKEDPKMTRFMKYCLGEDYLEDPSSWEQLHTSGHAYKETIQKLIAKTKPKVIIPMHTECADQFKKIMELDDYKDGVVRVLEDGERFTLA